MRLVIVDKYSANIADEKQAFSHDGLKEVYNCAIAIHHVFFQVFFNAANNVCEYTHRHCWQHLLVTDYRNHVLTSIYHSFKGEIISTGTNH